MYVAITLTRAKVPGSLDRTPDPSQSWKSKGPAGRGGVLLPLWPGPNGPRPDGLHSVLGNPWRGVALGCRQPLLLKTLSSQSGIVARQQNKPPPARSGAILGCAEPLRRCTSAVARGGTVHGARLWTPPPHPALWRRGAAVRHQYTAFPLKCLVMEGGRRCKRAKANNVPTMHRKGKWCDTIRPLWNPLN